VHHHLIREGLRTSVGSWSNPASRARCIISRCCRLRRRGDQSLSGLRDARRHDPAGGCLPPRRSTTRKCKRYIKAIGKGVLKVMSKMGISTYQSYCGAQIFDAVGLSGFRRQIFHRHGDPHRGRRPGRDRRGSVRRHRDAFGDAPV
jgi:glutamate synthase (NADPH) large chain